MAAEALAVLLRFSGPADEILSRYFRAHRALGRRERGFIAEATFAVLRRKRSLECAASSNEPRALLLAALVRVLGLSGRALEGILASGESDLIARLKAVRASEFPAAVRADLPDWLWDTLVAEHGETGALAIAQGMLNPAPLDLRVNLARTDREATLARLA